jgi:hypothetical protein
MRILWYIGLPAAVAAIVALVLALTAGGSSYDPPERLSIGLEQLELPTYERRIAPVVVDDRDGVMVLDTLHFNQWFAGELEPLLSKVTSRGYDINFFGDRQASRFLSDEQRVAELDAGLRGADSLLMVAPFFEYTTEEAAVVQRFVRKGGRVVLVGDPTRFRNVNQLATVFGLNFEADYLYNVVEHDANFRNVVFRDFADSQLTQGLDEIVLYTSGSITGGTEPLVRADGNTKSSTREAVTVLSPMVIAEGGRLVALNDSSFIEAPYDRVLDNDQLLSNLADYLTTSERVFDIDDVPGMLSDDVVVTALDSTTIDSATSVAGFLSTEGRRVPLETIQRPTVDTVFVGLYEDAAAVDQHLRAVDVVLSDGVIRSPGTPPMSQFGSGLLALDSRGGRNVLVVLASTEFELRILVSLLERDSFRRGLVSPTLGLYDFS